MIFNMERYGRRKAKVVDAILWDGTDETLEEAVKEPLKIYQRQGRTLWIHTSDGIKRVDKGDWIIKSPDGFSVCKASTFEMNYDKTIPLNARHW